MKTSVRVLLKKELVQQRHADSIASNGSDTKARKGKNENHPPTLALLPLQASTHYIFLLLPPSFCTIQSVGSDIDIVLGAEKINGPQSVLHCHIILLHQL